MSRRDTRTARESGLTMTTQVQENGRIPRGDDSGRDLRPVRVAAGPAVDEHDRHGRLPDPRRERDARPVRDRHGTIFREGGVFVAPRDTSAGRLQFASHGSIIARRPAPEPGFPGNGARRVAMYEIR